MKRVSSFVFVAALIIASACSSAPTAPVDTTVTLAPGQSSSVGALTVKFLSVTEDTRCPINALCIQAGDAYIALLADVSNTQRSFELNLYNPTNRAADIRGYLIAVEELTPYPYTVVPTQPDDYRLKLRITK